MMIDVIGVRPLGGYELEIEFSDGTIGVRDFSFICEKTGNDGGTAQGSILFRAWLHRGRGAHLAEWV